MASTNSAWPFKPSEEAVNTAASTASKDAAAKDEPAQTATTSRDSSFPVELPEDAALRLSRADFAAYVRELLRVAKTDRDAHEANRDLVEKLELASLDTSVFDSALEAASTAASTDASTTTTATDNGMPPNMTLTENAAPAFVSTQSELLDLFTELEKTVSGPRLKTLLDAAWAVDAPATLRIMWNARSIHLGKGEHDSFYRCLGWLFAHHSATLLANLPLLCRRIIAKKAPATGEDETDTVMVDDEDDTSVAAAPELRFGVSHGYWKDLLNVLVLAVRERLDVLANPRDVLNEPNPNVPRRKQPMRVRRKLHLLRKKQQREALAAVDDKAETTEGEQAPQKAKKLSPAQLREAKAAKNKSSAQERQAKEVAIHRRAVSRFMDPAYRALHLTVARLFAAQLAKDQALLRATDPKARANISLAAKWAPSLEKFHDKHTCIASTIAEILFPAADMSAAVAVRAGETARTAYLRVARERYRAEILAPLRKHLAIVEIPISASAIHTIDYNTVPSLAMEMYKDLFALKDFERFFAHVQKALEGHDPRTRVSGAVLLPATLVAQARRLGRPKSEPAAITSKADAAAAMAAKRKKLDAITLDAQWKTLVQRMRDAGSLPSTIAVVDVSGSMTVGSHGDKTTPMDTAIGLGLLIAEVVPPPFGGSFITFSATPQIVAVGGAKDPRTFTQKVRELEDAHWDMNTDFNAVFEKLLLPLALKHKVKQQDMVKTIVVLSDMQFDAADVRDHSSTTAGGSASHKNQKAPPQWETSHERIRRLFAQHGYELPRLVYWDLRANSGAKPVTHDTESTLLVSGYSQGMLRTFMEDGGFDLDVEENDPEADGFEEAKADADGNVNAAQPQRTRKVDPMAGLRKAIGHDAYKALTVVD